MKYEVKFTSQFKRDLKRAKKQGKNLDKLFAVVDLLAAGEKLDARFRDHDLSGDYAGTRECHIETDWLLEYEIQGDVLVLMLYRVGSHSELSRNKTDMNYEYYQRKINDVIEKCPVESGVQTLVYAFLDECIRSKEFSLVITVGLRKGMDKRLTTRTGISDIVVLPKDFKYRNEKEGSVCGFIEVKGAGRTLDAPQCWEQAKGQMKSAPHFIHTNGLVWRYYRNQKHKPEWECYLTTDERFCTKESVKIEAEKFEDLKSKLSDIQWD